MLRLPLLRQQRLLRPELVGLRLKRGDAVLEVSALRLVDEAAARDPDADEDPDDEREEDGRERRDVVAEVQHR